jgi:PAS domain S-box-containing protein
MRRKAFQNVNQQGPTNIPGQMRKIEGREWWLWGFAVAVTLALTLGIISFTFPWFHLEKDSSYWFDLREWVRGLALLVLLFDIYTVYQHLQLQRMRRQLAERDQLFQLISENAADMIALVDRDGHRLYNSPAYQKVLGYSADELKASSSLDQVHPDDRPRVRQAAEKARHGGQGERVEYRIRHKDGSWRTVESTANPVRNSKGETEKLVIVNRDITERKRAEEMLVHNAFHDGLTDLPNRALFLDRLQHALTLSKKHPNYTFAVLLIDIDEFKVINDSLGHTAGDELLIQIGRRLKESVRRADTVSRPQEKVLGERFNPEDALARLGGDEFTILLDDIRDPIEAVRVAERLQEELRTPFSVTGQEVVISASIGIAASNTPHSKAEDLLRDADIAMYRAKGAGKARSEVSDTAMHATAVKRLRLETDMRKGLEQGEFHVYYQPICSLPRGRIVGFEALSRWQRGDEVIPPADFIPIADETGLIIPLNRQLLREACVQLIAWQSQFPANPPLTLSVNVPPKQFAQPDLAADIRNILQQTSFDPANLNLEIIETVVMGDAEKAGCVLSQLNALGVSLSVDDFGTGYSSLSRLCRIPLDTLKIDRVFISNMDSDPESLEIARAIMTLAHNLDLKVVAEGVEKAEHVKQLQQLGCEFAQGYFFSRPVAPQAITALLAQQNGTHAATLC